MKKLLENPVLSLIARLVVGIVFIYAAVGKILDPHFFAREINNYSLAPAFLINIFAITLPWIEFIAAVFLIAGLRLKASSILIGIMLIIFIVAVGIAIFRGLDINCGCFGKTVSKVGWKKILENSGLLILCIYIYFFPVQSLTVERFFTRTQRLANT